MKMWAAARCVRNATNLHYSLPSFQCSSIPTCQQFFNKSTKFAEEGKKKMYLFFFLVQIGWDDSLATGFGGGSTIPGRRETTTPCLSSRWLGESGLYEHTEVRWLVGPDASRTSVTVTQLSTGGTARPFSTTREAPVTFDPQQGLWLRLTSGGWICIYMWLGAMNAAMNAANVATQAQMLFLFFPLSAPPHTLASDIIIYWLLSRCGVVWLGCGGCACAGNLGEQYQVRGLHYTLKPAYPETAKRLVTRQRGRAASLLACLS